MNASYVLGQANFTSAVIATTQSGMNTPRNVDYDATNNRLFVAEGQNNRVTVFNLNSIANGMNASNVLGQTLFTTATAATTQSGLDGVNDVEYVETSNRLFVCDQSNDRVLV
jgi:hypothetical protein